MPLARSARFLRSTAAPLAGMALIALMAGCAGGSDSKPGAVATAEMKPTQGQTAAGVITLRQRGDNVQVNARLSGLTPNQLHGFHVHEKGDCSAPDASSAGPHLNPAGAPHGAPHDAAHHAGDLPAVQSDASGRADLTVEVKGSLSGAGAADFVGKALVVHAQPDDFKTQPAGNSGARIACGVITAGK